LIEEIMIKRIAYLIASLLLTAFVLHAQQPNEAPFSVVDKAVKDEQGGWNGNKELLSRVFDSERRRLGPQFESELTKWIGADPQKHYWVSGFLDWESFLQGNKRLPELSLLIKEQGLVLVRGKNDDDSLGYVIGLSITAAILSDELGLKPMAISHKGDAETLLQLDPSLARHIPALSEAERKRYDSIPSVVHPKPPTVTGDAGGGVYPKAPIMGGVVNGRAVRLPKPEYPRAARESGASGTVQVRVLIDESGKVISAKAISGHPDLRHVSEDAAMRAEFTPTKLAGQAVKVTGVIIYNFVAR
jgi:TonB family protein